MQRCPACNARVGTGPTCSRCGADLGRILRCEQLAAAWLCIALQTLRAGKMDIATAAIRRSLSFRQTPAGKLVKAFLIEQLYGVLYENVRLQHWQQANATLSCLRALQAHSETLQRFSDMLDYFSAQHNQNADPDGLQFRIKPKPDKIQTLNSLAEP